MHGKRNHRPETGRPYKTTEFSFRPSRPLGRRRFFMPEREGHEASAPSPVCTALIKTISQTEEAAIPHNTRTLLHRSTGEKMQGGKFVKIYHRQRRSLAATCLTVVMLFSLFPTAFAGQENPYHDPAEHWMQANDRTNELDANAVVTHETFQCYVCGQPTSFLVFRTPEYTRDGQSAMSRSINYSDGTLADGTGKGNILDGTPGKDAYYTGYHWTKAVCETCGGINANRPTSDYGHLKNVYWIHDCDSNFFEELPEDKYPTIVTKSCS